VLANADEQREVFVELSGTANASEPESLPSPIGKAVATQGRSVIESRLQRVEPVSRLVVTSTAVRSIPRHGWYEAGDRLVLWVGDEWVACEFVRPGEPEEAIEVDDARVVEGSYRRDVAWVELPTTGDLVAGRYDELRPEVPGRG
jgi:hypothetical protein